MVDTRWHIILSHDVLCYNITKLIIQKELNKMKKTALFLVFGLFWHSSVFAKDIKVAVSIAPLHSLVSMVLGNLGQADLLAGRAANSHNLAMRPSVRRLLNNADIVFIIDKGMERVYAKAREDNLVAMTDHHSGSTELTLIPRRIFEIDRPPIKRHDHDNHDAAPDTAPDTDDADDTDDDHDTDGHGHFDTHSWLDPDNAVIMLDIIAAELTARYPEYGGQFMANAAAAKTALADLDAELSALLLPYKERNFIAFHDTYIYFEQAYGVDALASIVSHNHAAVSIKRIQKIREIISANNIQCLFYEPQFDHKILDAVDPDKRLMRIELDPLGSNQTAGETLYPAMMHRLGQSVIMCLKG